MTNGPGELTGRQERQLLECYATLHQLSAECDVPAVVAAVRVALAELHAAVNGQALDFDFYTHRWADGSPGAAALVG